MLGTHSCHRLCLTLYNVYFILNSDLVSAQSTLTYFQVSNSNCLIRVVLVLTGTNFNRIRCSSIYSFHTEPRAKIVDAFEINATSCCLPQNVVSIPFLFPILFRSQDLVATPGFVAYKSRPRPSTHAWTVTPPQCSCISEEMSTRKAMGDRNSINICLVDCFSP